MVKLWGNLTLSTKTYNLENSLLEISNRNTYTGIAKGIEKNVHIYIIFSHLKLKQPKVHNQKNFINIL